MIKWFKKRNTVKELQDRIDGLSTSLSHLSEHTEYLYKDIAFVLGEIYENDNTFKDFQTKVDKSFKSQGEDLMNKERLISRLVEFTSRVDEKFENHEKQISDLRKQVEATSNAGSAHLEFTKELKDKFNLLESAC